MVRSVSSLGRSGLQDWLVQRVSAVIIAAYFVFMMVFFFRHPEVDYASWHALFSMPAVKIFSLLALLSLALHAWVGLWTVSTDYIKCACIRVVVQVAVIIASISFLLWGVQILWG